MGAGRAQQKLIGIDDTTGRDTLLPNSGEKPK